MIAVDRVLTNAYSVNRLNTAAGYIEDTVTTENKQCPDSGYIGFPKPVGISLTL